MIPMKVGFQIDVVCIHDAIDITYIELRGRSCTHEHLPRSPFLSRKKEK